MDISSAKRTRLSLIMHALAEHMRIVSDEMLEHGGELHSLHAKELRVASNTVRGWAEGSLTTTTKQEKRIAKEISQAQAGL